MDNLTTLLAALGAVALGAIAAFFLRTALRARRELEASRGWPLVPGQITASRVKTIKRRSSSGNAYEVHDTEIAYAYEIAGASFTGERVHAGSSLGLFNPGMSEAKARETVERYPVGASVQVAYDPTRPERAVLEPGVGSGRIWVMVGLAAALFAIALFLVVVAVAAA